MPDPPPWTECLPTPPSHGYVQSSTTSSTTSTRGFGKLHRRRLVSLHHREHAHVDLAPNPIQVNLGQYVRYDANLGLRKSDSETRESNEGE